MPVVPIEEAIADIRQGKMIILTDDEDRENEGDLTLAAEMITPEAINFMARYGRGLICLALAPDLVERLQLPQMVRDNQSGFKTAFCISIEARRGVTTGISAADRATTIITAVADNSRPEDLVSPGHVFPIRARKGGVLVRTGQTEGSVDLSRLAGLKGAAVICEVMKDDGTMARMPDLEKFAAEHDLKIATIADLVAYRLRHESFVHRRATVQLPTYIGEFTAIAYDNDVDDNQHIALVKGEINPDERRAGAGPLGMRHRRRLSLPQVRLRRPAGSRHAVGGDRGQGRHPVHAPGGPGHRLGEQAPGLRTAGPGRRHGGGQ